eukprot:scaffold102929_cov103-Phaeocystis_antarctica.AAC.2
MHGQPARSNQGVCSVFASGGYPVTTACRDIGERKPRMHCFASEATARAKVEEESRLAADAAAAKAEKFRLEKVGQARRSREAS